MKTLTFTDPTVLKREPIQSTLIKNPDHKIEYGPGDKPIEINWHKQKGDHYYFELKEPKNGFYNWYAFIPHTEIKGYGLTQTLENGITQQEYAMLNLIAYAEGTDRKLDGEREGYNIIFTFQTFDDYSKHPQRKYTSNGITSSAAGRYQFLDFTWAELLQKHQYPDFGPASQDLAAKELIRRRKALTAVDAGDLAKALEILSWEWASLPVGKSNRGRYGQPIKTYQELKEVHDYYLGLNYQNYNRQNDHSVEPHSVNWQNPSSKVSKYFSVGEVTQWDSRRVPTTIDEEKSILMIAGELDRIREDWDGPIKVTSWLRPPAINRAVGGVSNSQHIKGWAVDIYPANWQLNKFYNWLKPRWKRRLGDGRRKGFLHLDLLGVPGGKAYVDEGGVRPSIVWNY